MWHKPHLTGSWLFLALLAFLSLTVSHRHSSSSSQPPLVCMCERKKRNKRRRHTHRGGRVLFVFVWRYQTEKKRRAHTHKLIRLHLSSLCAGWTGSGYINDLDLLLLNPCLPPSLSVFLNHPRHADVIIQVRSFVRSFVLSSHTCTQLSEGEGEIQAHKLLLCARSQYFRFSLSLFLSLFLSFFLRLHRKLLLEERREEKGEGKDAELVVWLKEREARDEGKQRVQVSDVNYDVFFALVLSCSAALCGLCRVLTFLCLHTSWSFSTRTWRLCLCLLLCHCLPCSLCVHSSSRNTQPG